MPIGSMPGNCGAGAGELIDRALKAAREAFGSWAEGWRDRARNCVHRLARRICGNKTALSVVVSADNGGLRHAIAAAVLVGRPMWLPPMPAGAC